MLHPGWPVGGRPATRALDRRTGIVHAVLSDAQTTTTEVQRIVGDPLPSGVVVIAGLVLFALIVIAGLVVRRRAARPDEV